MAIQDRLAQIIYGYGGDGYTLEPGHDGYIDALNLWQNSPVNLNITESVAYFVEVVCVTVTNSNSGFGCGSTKRMASFSLVGGTLTKIVQSYPYDDFGGLVYAEINAVSPYIPTGQPAIQVHFVLKNADGYYYAGKAYIRIFAYEPAVLPKVMP